MANLGLSVVTAYYLDGNSNPTQLLPENALMAEDLAPSWTAFRAAMLSIGIEPYISPPDDAADPRSADGYTKGFFRTPYDQALEVSEQGDGAAAVDNSPHQAGRAFDLDLDGMTAAFPNYDYASLVAVAAQYGFSARVSGEAWHFDDNPASNPAYGSVLAAVQAIGNTQAQVDADQAAGLPTPQDAAVSSNSTNTVLMVAGALGALWLLYRAMQPKPAKKEKTSAQEPQYVF